MNLLVIGQVSNGLAEEGLRILQASKGDLKNWAASNFNIFEPWMAANASLGPRLRRKLQECILA